MRFVFAYARHHLAAGRFGGGLHHFAAWRLAKTAPDRLATHGQRLGALAGVGFKTGHLHDFNVLLGKALDVLHEAFFVQADQADGFAAVAGAAGAPDAVYIVFADIRYLVVHHVWQLVNVNSAGGDVGGHQDAYVAVLEAGQCLRTGGLALVAVQRHRRDTVFRQVLGHVVGAEFGACENQHLAPVVLRDDVREQRFLFGAAHRVDGLRDALYRGVARRDLDGHRVAQQAVGQFADLVAESGREQQGLLLLGHQGQHFLDVMDEAHVQHAVGFVQDQHLHLRQVQRTLLRVVQQAAGGGHQNVHAAAQLVNLRAHANAAEHHHRGDVHVLAVNAHAFFNLRCEFARRRHDQSAHGIDAAAVDEARLGRQALQQGQRESRRFAGTGLGAAQQVTAGQHGRNGLHLNRGGSVVALLKHGLQDGRGQVQFFEFH